jgi:hypothetical protein
MTCAYWISINWAIGHGKYASTRLRNKDVMTKEHYVKLGSKNVAFSKG